MSYFTAIDLSQLPAPAVIESLTFETIFAEMLASLQSVDPAYTGLVESDPAYKILEVAAYRELILRQRINDSSRATMLAFAMGADLDQIAALYNVSRLSGEGDTTFRSRIQLSIEGFSTAGPEGSYIFWALSASSDVFSVSATNPSAGSVTVSVLANAVKFATPTTLVAGATYQIASVNTTTDFTRAGAADNLVGTVFTAGSAQGTGTGSAFIVAKSAPTAAASAATLAAVTTALSSSTVRPLTDNVTVAAATIVPFTISAAIYVFNGPDSSKILALAKTALGNYLQSVSRVGYDVTLSGIYAALHQAGVKNVTLSAPTADMTVTATQAAFCTALTLTTYVAADE